MRLSTPSKLDAMSEPTPRLSHHVYRRRRLIVFSVLAAVLVVVLALVISGVFYVNSALGAPVPTATKTVAQPAAIVADAPKILTPEFGEWAVGAVGFDTLMTQSASQEPMAIASLTKIVTALVVLQAKPIPTGEEGPAIEYTQADVDLYWRTVAEGGSVAPVAAGSSLTERQSLVAMLLASGNNYATSMAEWAYGSIDAYVTAANTWLAEHGLESIHLVDASGMSDDNVGSPRDLVALGEIALSDPVISDIVATKSAELPVIGIVENSNKMLGTHGVDGIKTGTTDDAANLLFSADYVVADETVTVIGVVLGAENHAVLDEAIGRMLDSIVPGFRDVVALEPHTAYADYSTVWGDTATARTTSGVSLLIWGATPIEILIEANDLELANKGAEVGTATVRAGDEVITVPLELDATIDDPGTRWRLENPGVLDEAGANALGYPTR